jgi:hypothetical protein
MTSTAPRQIPVHRTFRVLPGGNRNGGTVVADRCELETIFVENYAAWSEQAQIAERIKQAERRHPMPVFEVLSEADRALRRATTYARAARILTGQLRGPQGAA